MDKIKRLALAAIILALTLAAGFSLLPKRPPGSVPYAMQTTPDRAPAEEQQAAPGAEPSGDTMTPMP